VSLKFVTMREEADGLYSRDLERAYSSREEVFRLDSNTLLDY